MYNAIWANQPNRYKILYASKPTNGKNIYIYIYTKSFEVFFYLPKKWKIEHQKTLLNKTNGFLCSARNLNVTSWTKIFIFFYIYTLCVARNVLVLLQCVLFLLYKTFFLCASVNSFVTRNRVPTVEFGGGPNAISIEVVHLVGALRGGFHLIYLAVSLITAGNRERREYLREK